MRQNKYQIRNRKQRKENKRVNKISYISDDFNTNSSKSDRERQISYDITYMCSLKKNTNKQGMLLNIL